MLSGNSTEEIPLDKIDLDSNNPRFGFSAESESQAEILDRIVENFGVDDVISSIAVNGYFAAEPLVARTQKDSDRLTVTEGNRRLAACLIITGDHRARSQTKKHEKYSAIWREHGSPRIDPVPVLIYSNETSNKEVLSYLGVRHIAASKAWDSYAKAAWISKVVKETDLGISDVSEMIGDNHKTVARMLEGYNLVSQLIDTGHFNPEYSNRKGRGSITQYPFSWVYTVLGYKTVREFLKLGESLDAREKPLNEEALPSARLLFDSMFGNSRKGRSAAIEDSRQLGKLAEAFSNKEKIDYLEEGKNILDIERLTKPIGLHLRENLSAVRGLQREINSRLSETDLSRADALESIELATTNRKAATSIESKLKEYSSVDE